MVDFAAMREAVKILGGDPRRVHPARPTDLTVDHSLQIDFSKWYINRIEIFVKAAMRGASSNWVGQRE